MVKPVVPWKVCLKLAPLRLLRRPPLNAQQISKEYRFVANILRSAYVVEFNHEDTKRYPWYEVVGWHELTERHLTRDLLHSLWEDEELEFQYKNTHGEWEDVFTLQAKTDAEV